MSNQRILYIFLDEGGNFDFSAKGTKYFSLSCVTTERPFAVNTLLGDYLYDCIEYGLPQEYFHCAEDNSHVRRRVFGIISDHLNGFRIDSLVVEKCKTGPSLQEPKYFYPKMLGYLLRYVVNGQEKKTLNEVIVITDALPINEKRRAVEKSIKQTLSEMLTNDTRYRILHHNSRSHCGLQIADYCNWAILRKWERGDTEHYDQIKMAIKSEYNIFQNGTRKYY